MDLFAKEELLIKDENCAMRRANEFNACILQAQNIQNKHSSIINCVIILSHRSKVIEYGSV